MNSEYKARVAGELAEYERKLTAHLEAIRDELRQSDDKGERYALRESESHTEQRLKELRNKVAGLQNELSSSIKPGDADIEDGDHPPSFERKPGETLENWALRLVGMTPHYDILKDIEEGRRAEDDARDDAGRSEQAWFDSHERVARAMRVADAKTAQYEAQADRIPEITVGTKHEWNREAFEGEAGLKVDDYADSLCEVFSKAGSGEFSMAVLGPWGRGKTFLINRLARLLQGKGYETVTFSAWKYPTTPEVWVHLYETLADRACTGSLREVLPRVVRAGISRHGPARLLFALAALAFSLTPKTWLFDEATELLTSASYALGLGSLVWLASLAFGIHRTRTRLSRDFITATRHTEKLGLQATIGRDLKALLNGWMPDGQVVAAWATCCYFAIAGWIAFTAWKWIPWAAGTLSASPHVGVWVAFLVFAALWRTYVWIVSPDRKPQRVLLVIDDLDRCSTRQLLHVIESIKLLTEESAVSSRVQVAALIDEEILNHAILSKHKELKSTPEVARFSASRLIRESREKLFTAHLRLPPLTRDEAAEVLGKIVGKERVLKEQSDLQLARNRKAEAEGKLEKVKQETAPQSKVAVTTKHRPPSIRSRVVLGDVDEELRDERPLTDTEKRMWLQKHENRLAEAQSARDLRDAELAELQNRLDAAAADQGPNQTNGARLQFRFSRQEEEALGNAIAMLHARRGPDPLGPRAIRAFVFRYQLARCLADKLKLAWNPEELANLLAAASGEDHAIPADGNTPIARIVSQVS